MILDKLKFYYFQIFMLSRCFLDCSVGVGVFVTGLSQISCFFSRESSTFYYNGIKDLNENSFIYQGL